MEWRDNTTDDGVLINTCLGDPNEDWYISFNPGLVSSPFQVFAFLFREPEETGPETALMNGEMQLVLKGDFRKEMEQAFPNLEACIAVFDRHPEARSDWTRDPRRN